MPYFGLVGAAACSTVAAVLFCILERKTKFSKVPGWGRQVIYGLVFGAITVLCTATGVVMDGALVSGRDGAAMSAGMIFGAPAGIIAGVIGGLHAIFFGPETTMTFESGLVVLASGIIGSLIRWLLFDNRRPSWQYGFVAAAVMEVINILLVFTSTTNGSLALGFTDRHGVLLFGLNSGGIALAMLSYTVAAGEAHAPWKRRGRGKAMIAESFSRWLLLCVAIAVVFASQFLVDMQTGLAVNDTNELLSLYISDVRADINDTSDENLMALTRRIRNDLESQRSYDTAYLMELLEENDVSEINIVDENGIIVLSTTPVYVGFDMASGEQSSEFLPLLRGLDEYVQRYMPVSYDSDVTMKYAGAVLRDGGFVQVGYNAERFQRDIDEMVVGLTRNRHVGETGFMMIANENFEIVSAPGGNEGQPIGVTGIERDVLEETEEMDLWMSLVNGEPCFVMHGVAEGYYIIAVEPAAEVALNLDVSLYITVFSEILIFAVVFVLIFLLVKILVVDRIHKINKSLERITGGDLDVSVEVRSNQEFDSLSDDINSTVQTLKGYIAEAAARIDRELSFAKTIQSSTLPSVFPPYPERSDFEIYASMYTAKEVGGDFYDFYLLDPNRLGFLIADVSGKGISAAMFMMKAKTLIKGYAERSKDVAEILTMANRDLCENNEAEMFVTCWMGILDFSTHVVHFTNAGHNPPLVRRKDGSFEYFKSRPGFVLAGMDGVRYRAGELPLEPGDEIFLYTDGISEATDAHEQLYGEERLKDALNRLAGEHAKQLCDGVKTDVDEFVGEAPQFDDMTMLSLRLTPKNVIKADPRSDTLQSVLEFVEEEFVKAGVPMAVTMKMNIAADEIYTNIQRYSGASTASVECSVGGGLATLTFEDDGKPYNPLEKPDPDVTLSAEDREIGGLGIFMVKKTMDEVKYEYTGGLNRLTLKKRFENET